MPMITRRTLVKSGTAMAAAGALVTHLRDTQRSELTHVRDVTLRVTADALLIDPVTLRHLNVVEGVDGGRDGSLLAGPPDDATVLKVTATAPSVVILIAYRVTASATLPAHAVPPLAYQAVGCMSAMASDPVYEPVAKVVEASATGSVCFVAEDVTKWTTRPAKRTPLNGNVAVHLKSLGDGCSGDDGKRQE